MERQIKVYKPLTKTEKADAMFCALREGWDTKRFFDVSERKALYTKAEALSNGLYNSLSDLQKAQLDQIKQGLIFVSDVMKKQPEASITVSKYNPEHFC